MGIKITSAPLMLRDVTFRELRRHYGQYSKHTSEESQLHTWEKQSCKTTGAA